MALETELKLRVSDHEAVRAALKAAGARFIRRQLELNTFFDTPTATLLSQGAGLRVRRATDVDSSDIHVVITHKGPRRSGPMKVREENELVAESYDDAVNLLAALGYETRLAFEKKRDTWELGDCEIVLDTLPEELGHFVEIEGPDGDRIDAIRHKLNLDDAPIESEGYAVLVAMYLKLSDRRKLTFAD